MARPTQLTKDMLDTAKRYLDVELVMGGLYHGDLPTVAGLSLYVDVSRDSIYEWAKVDSPIGRKFSDTLGRLNSMQEYKLIGKSLKGEYNPTITKLLLTKHGYADKTEQEVRVKEMPQPLLGGTTPMVEDDEEGK